MSLRDVERTLAVMIWFYEHRQRLFPQMNQIPDRNRPFSAARMLHPQLRRQEKETSPEDEEMNPPDEEEEQNWETADEDDEEAELVSYPCSLDQEKYNLL